MAVRQFSIPGDATRREYSIYAAIATPRKKGRILIYVGNTGDSKRNCNPVICWAGNHFSHNVIHAHHTIRIAEQSDQYDYRFLYSSFDHWKDDALGRERVELINEMERELNRQLQLALKDCEYASLVNPHAGTGNINKAEKVRRQGFHTRKRLIQVRELCDAVMRDIQPQA